VYGAGCGDSNALNYDDTITCPDNNDCVYCGTDPGIPNATIQFHDSGTYDQYGLTFHDKFAHISWNEIDTSGSNTGMTSTNGAFQKQDGNHNLYKVQYQFKLPGQSYSSWYIFDTANLTDDSCGFDAVKVDAPGQGTGIDINGITFGGFIGTGTEIDLGWGLPSDGRFNAGVRWRFRIRNLCTDCSVGPGNTAAAWTTGFVLQQDIITTITLP
jgi:hypothetical protein